MIYTERKNIVTPAAEDAEVVKKSRSNLFAGKKDPEETIESSFAYTKSVLNQYKNCYVPDRLVKKFGKKNVISYIEKLFPQFNITLDACLNNGYVINTSKKEA